MKLAIISDTHWGVRNDSQIFMRYFERFYDEIFFPYLQKHNIKTILHGGDVVDRRKYINYVTLRNMRRVFIDRCADEGIEMHAIVGNHDVPYRNTNEVNAVGALYVPDYMSQFHIINYSEPTTIQLGGMDICLIPWVNSSNYEKTLEVLNNTKANFVLGHLELSGFEMYRGVLNHHGSLDTKVLKNFDTVLSGHFHHRSTKGNITYLGSPYEMTWADYNDTRGFHVLDTDTREIEFVRNPYRMFHKLVYNDVEKTLEDMTKNIDVYTDTYVKVVVQEKTSDNMFDILLDSLTKVSPANISIVEDHKNLDQESNEDIIENVEDTVSILNKYVESMNIKQDKKKLQKLFGELHNEAQSITL